jgi:hypothetical protein
MRSRPPAITVAAILMALFSLMNFPGPWWYAVPGAEETPAFIIYSGIVGIVVAVGLWMLKTWSYSAGQRHAPTLRPTPVPRRVRPSSGRR